MESTGPVHQHSDIFFIIIGPISKKYNCDSIFNAKFIEWVDQYELAKYIGMSDLCLAGHFNGEIKKADRTIPTKAYIYEAMNKHMVLGDSKANHEKFCEDEFHSFVKRGDPHQLAQKILEKKKSRISIKEGNINE